MLVFRKWVVMILAFAVLASVTFPAISNSPQVLANANNQVTIYYKTGFSNAFIHYRPTGGTWTKAPGVKLLPAEVPGFQKITLSIGAANGIEACFNNGGSTWDSNSMKNYLFPNGTSTYTPGVNGAAGKITAGLPYVDTVAPSVPAGLKADSVTSNAVKFSWTASTDNMSVAAYQVFRDQVRIATLSEVTHTDSAVSGDKTYVYTVRAVDMAGNVSEASAPLEVKTPVPVNNSATIYYKAPAGWTSTFIHYRGNLGTWTTAPGTKMSAGEVAGYSKITLPLGNSTSVEAVFNNGGSVWDNNSMKNYVFPLGVSKLENGVISAGAPFSDTSAPTAPLDLALKSKTAASVSLNWGAATDDVGVTGYELYRDQVRVATLSASNFSFTDSNLKSSTKYTYFVRAVDSAGNVSPASNTLEVTTEQTTQNAYTVYYKIPAAWNSKAFMHFRYTGSTWTAAPGQALNLAESNPAYALYSSLSDATSLEAVFNNGGSTWDNNGMKNYLFSPGVYTLADGKITSGAPAVPTLQRLNLTPANVLEVELNSLRNVMIEAVYSDGSKVDVTSQAVLTSREPGTAVVTAPGQVKGVTLGTTTLDVVFKSLIAELTVTVVKGGTTKPTSTSVNSLYLSNWKDNINIWMASKLAQTDRNTIYGPRIAEMRVKEDFGYNQIRDYTSYFRNETTKADYTDVAKFGSDAYLDENGALRTKYTQFNGGSMPVGIKKDYVTVPNQDFTVATLTFTNDTDAPIEYNMLEQLRLNNKSTTATHSAWYDATSQTMFANMTASGQFFAAITPLQPVNSYQIGDSDEYNTGLKHAAPLANFRATGVLNNNVSRTSNQIALGFQDKFVIPARGSVQRSFVVSIEPTLDRVKLAIETARGKTAEQWFAQTASLYLQWMTAPGKKQLSFEDEGFQLAYKRNLVMIKNSINPVSGAMPATTNPFGYGYKVWARDSAVTAIILDQAGFYEETRKYWYWLNARMRDDGTVGTCYDLWTDRWVPFVDPEHDSIGFFLLGVYNHYKLTGDKQFLQDMWNKYKKSADFVTNTSFANSNWFGAIDHSIWEEFMEYNSFTQAAYVAGMKGAQLVARELGQATLADRYRAAEERITAAIQRPDAWGQGLWNEQGQYYNRAVMGNGSIKTLVDASSAALIVYGVVDAKSTRAQNHIQKIKSNLQHDGFGVARYDNDDYYNTSIYNPGGNEALSNEPAWPQMSMYVALHHIYRGENEQAYPYMKWMIERMFSGYMAQGEAVSNVLKTPIPSTSPEPVTAAWYMYTALAFEGKADVRVTAPTTPLVKTLTLLSKKSKLKSFSDKKNRLLKK